MIGGTPESTVDTDALKNIPRVATLRLFSFRGVCRVVCRHSYGETPEEMSAITMPRMFKAWRCWLAYVRGSAKGFRPVGLTTERNQRK